MAPANNFSVARVRRNLPNRSNIGMLFVNRQATGDLAGNDNHNRTYALDGRWGIGQYGQVLGFVSRTQTPGLEGKDHAYNLVGATARKRGGWSSGILKLLTTSTRRWAF